MPAGEVATPPPVLRAAGLGGVPGLAHGFCGRQGGASAGAFASLNVSRRVGDHPDAVRENWRRVELLAPPGGRFAAMRQVHGTGVVRVSAEATDAGEADALVTAAAGIWLTVLTADCVPLVLVAPERRVAAVVHAGWRGAAAGIVPRTLHVLGEAYGVNAAELHAAVGPAIDGCCYEVEAEVAAALAGCPGAATRSDTWTTESGAGKQRVDLRACVTAQLAATGVVPARISRVGPCTRCAGAQYFSHRGSGGRTGRQVSFVGWYPAL